MDAAPDLDQLYCASKAAVRAFTDALRRELIATRIRVMTVDPGQVLTVSVLLLPEWARSDSISRSSPLFAMGATKQRRMPCMRTLLVSPCMGGSDRRQRVRALVPRRRGRGHRVCRLETRERRCGRHFPASIPSGEHQGCLATPSDTIQASPTHIHRKP